MDLILLAKAAVMGVVEGLTEFLPISSTGHLILAGALLGFDDAKAKVFDIAIQTGAILAVVIVYWQKIRSTIVALPSQRQAQRFALNVLIAFLPAVMLGLVFGNAIKEHLFTRRCRRHHLHRRRRGHPVGRTAPADRRARRERGPDDATGCAQGRPGAVPGDDPGHQPQRRHHHRRHAARAVAPDRHRLLVLPRHPDAGRRRRVQPVQGTRAAHGRATCRCSASACCSRS